MSFFGVTIEKLESVKPHPGADRLDIGKLTGKGFQFILGKGTFKEGDEVLYIPVDALLPQELAKALGLEGKLAGKDKNRVKTIRLRNEISQGIVAPLKFIDGCADITPEGITEFLKIQKYEPPEVADPHGRLLPLPGFLSKYDIEGCDRHVDVVEKLMDLKVYISEKLEGSNASFSYDLTTDKFYVNQRQFTIFEIEGYEHTFWKVARRNNIFDKLKAIANQLGVKENITLYSEMLGPGYQSNIYHLIEHMAPAYDIKIDGKWVNSPLFFDLCKQNCILTVPIIAKDITLREWLNGETVQKMSNGKSILYDTLREGIVIKPIEEQFSYELSGRLFIKQRDPIYLDKSGN